MLHSSRLLFALIILACLSVLPNLGLYEFKNEESLRTIIALEMQQSGDFVQPTYLGEPYFKKPPMYTWMTLAAAKLTGWNELAPRIPSVVSLFLTCMIIFIFMRLILFDIRTSLFASLLYVTTFDVLFFYGFIGEIDGTFSMFMFATMASLILSFEKKDSRWLLVAGLLTSVGFMLKGFPAFVFYGATLIVLIFWYKRFRILKNHQLYISFLLCIALPGIWVLNNIDPIASFQTLFFESANRTKESLDIMGFIKHLFVFPLQNFIKLLPASLFLLLPLVLLFLGKQNKFTNDVKLSFSPMLKLLLIITLVNYMPYILSSGARVRYILPILPIITVITAYVLVNFSSPLLQKRFIQTVIVIITLRFALGLIVIPIVMDQRDIKVSDKRIAEDIMASIDLNDKNMACDCTDYKAVCLYIDINQNRILKTQQHSKDWEYLISCKKEPEHTLVKQYPKKRHTVFVYRKTL